MRHLLSLFTSLLVSLGVVRMPPVVQKFAPPSSTPTTAQLIQPSLKIPPDKYVIDLPYHEFQAFNNCGPASLAMLLRYYGVSVSGKELGQKIRPYQNPKGDNDDKTVFTQEFVRWAKAYNLDAVVRPAGDMELLKTLVANNFPVVVKTLLHANDDIAHFRIVTGWDETAKQIIQDDSYEGKNKKIPAKLFMQMWQPFNYTYIVIYRPDQEIQVKALLADRFSESVSWQKALDITRRETDLNPDSVYPLFNEVVAAYHLGDYSSAISIFESIESQLPRRMLWYQIEPIQAYYKLGDYYRVLTLSDQVLNANNRAFSELYQLRGDVYTQQGDKENANAEYAKMTLYNANYERR